MMTLMMMTITIIIIIIIYSEPNVWRNTLFNPSEHETNINYLEIHFPPHIKHANKETKDGLGNNLFWE